MNNNNDRFRNFGAQNPNSQSRPYPGTQNPNPQSRPYPGMQNQNPQSRPYPGMQNQNPQSRPYPGMQNQNPQSRPYPGMQLNPQIRSFPGMQNPNPYNRPIPIAANIINQNPKNTNVNLKKKDFFKKKAFIISMSSILGIGVVGTAVIVPLFLTTDLFKNNSFIGIPFLNKMTAIYDLPNLTANLLISGENLPINGEEYTIYNVTNANARAKVQIPSYNIKLNPFPNNEINLAVYDESIISTSKYEVLLKSGESIVSTPEDSKLQPSFTIVNQPQNQIIGDSSVNSVNLSISISAISNEISGELVSYKWYISDDTSTWTPLENSNTSNYTYDISGLTTKKYLKCEVSYKYAPTITSTIVYVERTTGPVISIDTQPTNHTISQDAETPTLSVLASVTNADTSQQLRYQWYSSNSPDSGFTSINNATSSTYKVDNATATKKYFKCEVSYQSAQTITSNVVYVERVQGPVTPPPPIVTTPVLSFRTQPTSVTVPYIETTTTLTVAVAIANPANGVQPSYKWYISDNGNNNWTLINDATHASYTYNVSSLEHSVKKYFKCEVNYDRATAITSNIAYVQRDIPSGPTPEEINAAITAWNRKDEPVKTSEFNSLMANPIINEKIKDYMLKQGGMAHFFAANVYQIYDNATQHYIKAQNGLTEAFGKYNIDNIETKPFFQDDGKNFMSLKGVFNPKKPPENQIWPNTPKDNINDASRYLFHDISSLGTYVRDYNFFSIETNSYGIDIQSDFTLKFGNFRTQSNFIISGQSMNYEPFYLRYNRTLLFTNATLFPGLSEFVKTTLLKL